MELSSDLVSVDLDRPERETARDRAREFFAFVIRGRYFWVRPVEGGCGPVYATLAEAMGDANVEFARDPAYSGLEGAVEILEVRRRDRMRRVWCSDPALMDAPIKRGPEPGVDFFPAEWVSDRRRTQREDGDGPSIDLAPLD